jgi:hypothetical protein
MISEQSLDGWDNNPVKFSNVKYPQTKDENAPKNFFLAIFCGSRGSRKTCLLTKLLKLLEVKKIYYEGIEIPHDKINEFNKLVQYKNHFFYSSLINNKDIAELYCNMNPNQFTHNTNLGWYAYTNMMNII